MKVKKENKGEVLSFVKDNCPQYLQKAETMFSVCETRKANCTLLGKTGSEIQTILKERTRQGEIEKSRIYRKVQAILKKVDGNNDSEIVKEILECCQEYQNEEQAYKELAEIRQKKAEFAEKEAQLMAKLGKKS